MSDLVDPDLFIEVATMIKNGEDPVEAVEDDGFVLQTEGWGTTYTFVGYREQGDTYVVGRIRRKKETINQSDPRLKTSENVYSECELYRMEVPDPTVRDAAGRLEDRLDQSDYIEKIDTGYINGYRLTRLRDVIEDTFKWY